MRLRRAYDDGGPPEPEVLVSIADPETLPDAAIRLVERRAVRANLKEEQDRLKQHEAEANQHSLTTVVDHQMMHGCGSANEPFAPGLAFSWAWPQIARIYRLSGGSYGMICMMHV